MPLPALCYLQLCYLQRTHSCSHPCCLLHLLQASLVAEQHGMVAGSRQPRAAWRQCGLVWADKSIDCKWLLLLLLQLRLKRQGHWQYGQRGRDAALLGTKW